MKCKYTQIIKLWADMGYQGKDLRNNIQDKYSIDLEVIKRPPRRFWVHKDTLPEELPKIVCTDNYNYRKMTTIITDFLAKKYSFYSTFSPPFYHSFFLVF